MMTERVLEHKDNSETDIQIETTINLLCGTSRNGQLPWKPFHFLMQAENEKRERKSSSLGAVLP